MHDNELLDKTIDSVAKAMTSAPVDARLAHRVAMRIADMDVARGRSSWLRPWILVPAAGLCVLSIAVFVAREHSVRLKPDATKTVKTATAAGSNVASGPNVVSGFSRTGDPERVALRTTAPLAPPAPINVAPIVVDRLDVAPMALSEIEIIPIAVDRIDISAMP